MPGKNELRASLLATLQAPLQQLLQLLQAPAQNFVYLLKAKEDKESASNRTNQDFGTRSSRFEECSRTDG